MVEHCERSPLRNRTRYDIHGRRIGVSSPLRATETSTGQTHAFRADLKLLVSQTRVRIKRSAVHEFMTPLGPAADAKQQCALSLRPKPACNPELVDGELEVVAPPCGTQLRGQGRANFEMAPALAFEAATWVIKCVNVSHIVTELPLRCEATLRSHGACP